MTPAANPQGRIDVLMMRIAELLGRRYAPVEWPVFEPYVEQWARRRFGPRRRRA